MNVAAGHTLTLDGQSDTDTYVVNTAGGLADRQLRHQRPRHGREERRPRHADRQRHRRRRRLPAAPGHVHRHASNFSLEYAETPAFVALLHGSVNDVFHRLNAGRRADQLRREHQLAPDRQRLRRRRHLRGRRQRSITTLDGGAGDDTFLIGQAYANPRVAPDVAPEDAFPTVYTTLGWLSNGVSFPTTVFGGTGNDSFLVYSNKAALQARGRHRRRPVRDPDGAAASTRATGIVIIDTFASQQKPTTTGSRD